MEGGGRALLDGLVDGGQRRGHQQHLRHADRPAPAGAQTILISLQVSLILLPYAGLVSSLQLGPTRLDSSRAISSSCVALTAFLCMRSAILVSRPERD